MQLVSEVIDGAPFDRPARSIQRDERKLFEKPDPNLMRFVDANPPPLAVYAFPSAYEPIAFAPPRGVFEGKALRLEWQTINGRQPFYHRNADVDEIGYQICGERTQITECGTIELRPGQFSSIPVAVAHDNYGRSDIHLIFYVPGPAKPCVPPVAVGSYLATPFEGWEAKPMLEISTTGLGAPHCDVAYSMVDEVLLLKAALHCEDKMQVLEAPAPSGGVAWIYKAPGVWIGQAENDRTLDRTYVRHLCADEIQYQIEGRRTLVSQRGVVTLNPGDFTSIPMGCAFASVSDGPSKHLAILTSEHVPPVRAPDRLADADVLGFLEARATLSA
jgi:uncharacterized cupin superfamily protein